MKKIKFHNKINFTKNPNKGGIPIKDVINPKKTHRIKKLLKKVLKLMLVLYNSKKEIHVKNIKKKRILYIYKYITR